MGKLIDLTGQRFGRLLILSKDQENKNGQARWLCKCDCGNEKVIVGTYIRSGLTQSCGCLNREISSKIHSTHGQTQGSTTSKKIITSEYQAWLAMKKRCAATNRKDSKHYALRGISVSPRWINSFENFLEDVGLRPSPNHSIDRIDVNGNYEPGNVKWSDRTEQALNKRVYSRSISGCKGVTWSKTHSKWWARINVNGKRIHIGYFTDIDEAIEARKQAEIKYFGKALAN